MLSDVHAVCFRPCALYDTTQNRIAINADKKRSRNLLLFLYYGRSALKQAENVKQNFVPDNIVLCLRNIVTYFRDGREVVGRK
jgi:hypothetical protein